MIMNKALVAISFGTGWTDAREKCIMATEEALAQAFPGYDLARAFTSRTTLDRLEKLERVVVENPLQVMNRLLRTGYRQVLVQPLLIIPGIEYERLLADLRPFENSFERLEIGAPLLDSREDFRRVAEIFKSIFPAEAESEAVLLMGHGTRHEPFRFPKLKMPLRAWLQNFYVATAAARPGLVEVIPYLRANHIHRVTLVPFMLVAGGHARHDMAGDDDLSWKSILRRGGFEVSVRMTGLGEIEEIRDLFIEHARRAEKSQPGPAGADGLAGNDLMVLGNICRPRGYILILARVDGRTVKRQGLFYWSRARRSRAADREGTGNHLRCRCNSLRGIAGPTGGAERCQGGGGNP